MNKKMRAMGGATTLLVLLLLSAAVPARAVVRIDGSSDENVAQSFNRMLESLDADGRVELQTAIIQLNLVGVSSAREMLDNPELRNPGPVRIKARIAGLSAEEIIALAKRTATTRVVTPGQEPGVPANLLSPLAGGEPAHALASTQWHWVSNVNGHVSEQTLRFKAGGLLETVPPSTAGVSHWEQSAGEIRVFINDRYSVARGEFIDADHMRGTAGNRMGTTWTWTATRQ